MTDIELIDEISNIHVNEALESADFYNNNSLDMVCIDLDHTYESTMSYLQKWSTKIKSNGILCGDDWASKEGVRLAVTEFFAENDEM